MENKINFVETDDFVIGIDWANDKDTAVLAKRVNGSLTIIDIQTRIKDEET